MRKALKMVKDIHDKIVHDTDNLKFDGGYPQHCYAMCLHGTILETSFACISLLELGQFTPVHLIIRNMLESLADLRILCECPNYLSCMKLAYLNEKISAVKRIKTDGLVGSYLKPIIKRGELDDALTDLQKDAEEIKSKGFCALNGRDKLELAGLYDVYKLMWPFLSRHMHNNLDALAARHMEYKEGEYQVHYFKMIEEDDFFFCADAAATIPLDSLRSVRELLKIEENKEKFNQIEKMVGAWRKQYMGEYN